MLPHMLMMPHKMWRLAEVSRWDTYGQYCQNYSTSTIGNVHTENHYVCEADTFRLVNKSEEWCASIRGYGFCFCGQNDVEEHNGPYATFPWVCQNGFYKWDNFALYYAKNNARPYATTTIRTQTWLAENLKKGTTGTCYGDDESNCEIYGALFTLEEAKNACAAVKIAGVQYHLPSQEEWKLLFNALLSKSGSKYSNDPNVNGLAKDLKGAKIWNHPGTDDYFFSALPGGFYREVASIGVSSYEELENSATFWADADEWTPEGYIIRLSDASRGVYYASSKSSYVKLASVRCVSDELSSLPPTAKD